MFLSHSLSTVRSAHIEKTSQNKKRSLLEDCDETEWEMNKTFLLIVLNVLYEIAGKQTDISTKTSFAPLIWSSFE